jgi:hypothetical protein
MNSSRDNEDLFSNDDNDIIDYDKQDIIKSHQRMSSDMALNNSHRDETEDAHALSFA